MKHTSREQHMKKLIIVLTLLTSFSSFADLVINVKTGDGITLSSVGVYASTSGSFFCTHLNGDFERVPKIFDQNIAVNTHGTSNQINVVENLTDNCRSELKGLSLKVHHPKINLDHSTIQINPSNVPQDQNLQKFVYKKIASPYGDFYALEGLNSQLLVGPGGKINAEITIEE
jgi:hypothetical protein